MSIHDNREAGKTFELVFERACKIAGIYADQNHLKARRAWKGKLIALPSNLDFTLISNGRVGFFDCKNFKGDHFTFSDITDRGRREHQLAMAVRYNEMGVPSGFVVWFRDLDVVSYFPGLLIHRCRDSKFHYAVGRQLGGWANFDVSQLLSEEFPLASGWLDATPSSSGWKEG